MSDNSELTMQNVVEVVIFRVDDVNGADVEVTLNVNEEKTAIALIPQKELDPLQNYYLGINPVLEDYADNTILAVNKTYISMNHVGIDTGHTGQQFDVYPNPVKGTLTIKQTSPSGEYELTLFSVSGKIIHQQTAHSQAKISLDLSQLQVGLYLLKIESQGSNEIQYFKVVKE